MTLQYITTTLVKYISKRWRG